MRVLMLLTSLTAWTLENTVVFHRVNGHKSVMDEMYTLRSCDDNGTRYITHGSRSDVYAARNSIHCATKCQRNELCNYAVFEKKSHGRIGQCHIIFSIFKNENGSAMLLSEKINSEDNGSSCHVISKQSPHPLWETISISNIKKLQSLLAFTQMKSKGWAQSINIEHVSEMQFLKEDLAIALMGHRVSFEVGDGKISIPVRNRVIQLSFTSGLIHRLSSYPQFDGSLYHSTYEQIQISQYAIYAKSSYESNDGIPKVSIAYTLANVRQNLNKGYRRLVNHPSSMHVVIINAKQIVFQINEVSKASFTLKENAPVASHALREIFTTETGERYTIPLMYNSRKSAGVIRSEQVSMPWIFDDSWRQVLTKEDNMLYTALQDAIMQGHEIRLVLEDELSTDITIATTIPGSDMIANMPHETLVRNVIVPGTTPVSSKLLTRYRLFTGEGIRLLCTYRIHSATVTSTGHETLSPDSIKWYVSEYAWEKRLVLEDGMGFVFGNKSDLISLALSGKTIRVCVVKNTNVTFCFTANTLMISANPFNTLILQSMPFLDPELLYEWTQVSSKNPPFNKCRRVYLTVTTTGFVSKQEFDFGSVTQPEAVYVNFKSIMWFVEMT